MNLENYQQNKVQLCKKGGIYINPKNKGKFTATKKKTGKSTEELTHSKNPITKKRAVFAQNAKKWKHELGGQIDKPKLLPRKALARTFKKMAKHDVGGTILPKPTLAGITLQEVKIPDKLPLMSVNVPTPTQKDIKTSFSDAFKEARGKGLNKFSWNGKLYTTEMKTSTPVVAPKGEVKDRIAATNVDASKDRVTPVKSKVKPVVVTSSKKAEYVKPSVPAKKQESKDSGQEIKKKTPSKPTETKVEVPTRTVKQRIPETKKPYITFKPGESQTFESKKSNVEPTKRYISNIEEARKILKDKNVMDTPLNPKHRGYLHTALEEIVGKYKKGGKLTKDYIKKAHEKPGGSNVGKKKFASGAKRTGPYIGPSGGSPKGSYPIPDLKHARSALALAHHAPNPEGIKAAVYRKYPELKK